MKSENSEIPKTPIQKLESRVLNLETYAEDSDAISLMKDIIINQDKRIIDLELTVDTLKRQIDRK